MSEDNNSDDVCAICNGTKVVYHSICPYCNGTGEWNQAADAYVKNHICQCIFFDRENCPVCHKKCHHDASLSPKQKMDPGWGGTTTGINFDSGKPDVTVIDA